MIRKTLFFTALSLLSITMYGQVTKFYIDAETNAIIRSLDNGTNIPYSPQIEHIEASIICTE